MTLPLADGFMSLTTGQIAVLGSVAAIIFAVRRWRMVVVRKRNQAMTDRPREKFSIPPSPAAGEGRGAGAGRGMNPLNVREVTTEIHALLADVEETARRVAAQIDNRRVRMEQLMVDADEKIKRLESLTRAELPTPVATPSPPPPPALPHVTQRRCSTGFDKNGVRRPRKKTPPIRPFISLPIRGKTPERSARHWDASPARLN